MNKDSNQDAIDSEEYKSKTQVKKELHALQDLGKVLLELPLGVYQSLPIPEDLDEAIKQSRKITSHVARKRQIQYIGKLMRQIDVEPIQHAYDEWKNGRKKLAREHQQLEKTRELLLSGNKDTLNEIIEQHPECDIQQLRQLIRLAQQEQKLQKPPKNYRKLFQFLKEL